MPDSAPQLIEDFNKSLKGGRKRRGNASLKAWVTFVKKVAREEKIPYGAAMKRAKVRKDKGEKWMMGGEGQPCDIEEKALVACKDAAEKAVRPANEPYDEDFYTLDGGRRRKGKSHKKHGGSKKRRGGRRGTKKRRY